MHHTTIEKAISRSVWVGIAMCAFATANATREELENHQNGVSIPETTQSTPRLVTIDDIVSLRTIDTLSVSPDGVHFAVFIRQGDPINNDYRTGWFVGRTDGSGRLLPVGDGGQVRPTVRPTGHVAGDIAGSESKWSADGQWIAYTRREGDEVQLWRSRVDGAMQEQLTHSAGNIRNFEWRADGLALYFTTESSRKDQRAQQRYRERLGYRYDEDVYFFTDFMAPQLMRPLETDLSIRVVFVTDRGERLANPSERVAFEAALVKRNGGIEKSEGALQDAVVPPVRRSDGALSWLSRSSTLSTEVRVMFSTSSNGSDAIPCLRDECSGAIKRLWWSDSGDRVLIWRGEGINDAANGFYTWLPATGRFATIARLLDDELQRCELTTKDRLICARETPTRPAHVVAIDLRSGLVQVLADVNPEFRSIRLGRVERFEWDTPAFHWNEAGGELHGLYPKRAYGYILYPPDFDPTRKYPVFVDPYVAQGFNSYAVEHALHVYAANGFIVLDTAFPQPTDVLARLGARAMKTLYSQQLDFPHLSMLMESTVGALNSALARGFIDQRRVGIGGVSHGTFVPLHMMQKYDRIAAISISSPTWGPHEYYWGTRAGRESLVLAYGKAGYEDWRVRPDGKGKEFWSQIDIADHVDTIEAPILMHIAADETYGLVRLIRHMADAGKPYDAYVFANETHIKWQPAHLQTIMNRNLDWFRFWLQGFENPQPVESDQYIRWRALAKQQQSPDRVSGVRNSGDGPTKPTP